MTSASVTRTMGLRALFSILGMAAGAGAGWLAYSWSDGSWALAVFVGLLVMNLIARGVADVITDPQKGRRLVFFTLPTLLAAGGAAGAYALWDRWWLAVLIGAVFYFIGQVVVTVMFPRIAAEEQADSAGRMGLGTPPRSRPIPGQSESDDQWPFNDKRF
ncbi:MAG TPA: hypothetical protein VLS92_06520 [Acidimicrobiia bacterium]|nr:hypothetical protein [Acidimicrobiia bacterium]